MESLRSKKHKREEDKARAIALYKSGLTVREVASQLAKEGIHMHYSTVWRACKDFTVNTLLPV